VNVLVACEYSGAVRDAFAARGHLAVSCDLIDSESETDGYHIRGDVLNVLPGRWDMVIAFPPCTDLCISGARWFAEKKASGEQQRAVDFFMSFANAPHAKVVIENPVGIMSSRWRKPDQIIQPWQFGHGETKATCLWLKGVPPLRPTNVVAGREPRTHYMAPGPNRGKERARTYTGIAQAMAAQWGSLAS
jgi:site-specific DNA-cytosine methylase